VARAVGAKNADTLEALLHAMPPAVYYLDNLESVAEEQAGQHALRLMRQLPGVRLLVSSRVSLQAVLGPPIVLGVLPDAAALRLFRELYSGSDPLPGDPEIRAFVIGQLGAHALSVTLSARLGDCYSYLDLVKRWESIGTALAQDPQDSTRLGSLPVSLRLTAEALGQRDGTLALWTAAALFANGLPDDLLTSLEVAGGWGDARIWLVRHHVLGRRDERWHMLPPLARYALDASLRCEAGFDWADCRRPLQVIFDRAAGEAVSVASTDDARTARRRLLDHFGSLARLMEQEMRAASPDLSWLAAMHAKLTNIYQSQVGLSRELLASLASKLERPESALKVLGDLEARLGRPDAARGLYDRALVGYEKENDGLGQADTLQALGSLEVRLGRLDAGRGSFDRALVLFKQERNGLGYANTLLALGHLESRLGGLDVARGLYDRALVLYEKEQDALGQANALRALGDAEKWLDRHDAARDLYDQALVLFEREQIGMGQANVLLALANLEIRLGRLDAARGSYERALVLYEKEEIGLGQANVLQGLGGLELRLGRPHTARGLLDRSLLLFEKEQNGLGQANTLRALGDLEDRLGRLDAARGLFDRALLLYEKERDGQGQANTLLRLGQMDAQLGRLDVARGLYDRALVLYEKEQDAQGRANTLKGFGDLESRLGRHDAARDLYDQVLVLYEKVQSGLGQANTLQAIGDELRKSGAAGEAAVAYERALSFYLREQEPMGMANTFAELARCRHSLQDLVKRDEALERALEWAKRSGSEQVGQYIMEVLVEVTGGQEKAKAWVASRT
jgi:tetratricopeptide (TPR) repeat protein